MSSPARLTSSRKHVLHDLCPYICVFEDCQTPDLLYRTSKLWTQHLDTEHISEIWRCNICDNLPEQVPQSFESSGEFEQHLFHNHTDALSHDELQLVIKFGSLREPESIDCCMFCGWVPLEASETNRHELLGHVATEHLQKYAMLSLPWIYSTTTNATSSTTSGESHRSKESRNMMLQEPMPAFHDESAFTNRDTFGTKGYDPLYPSGADIVPAQLCEELKAKSRDRTTAECMRWIISWNEAIIDRGVVEHRPWEPDTTVRSQSHATSQPIHADLL